MRLPEFLRRIFQQDGQLSELVASFSLQLSTQLSNFERTVTEKLMEIEDRLRGLDEKLDAQAERLNQTVNSMQSNITDLKDEVRRLGEAEQERLSPFLDKLDEDVNNFAQIGAEMPTSTSGGTSSTDTGTSSGNETTGTDAGASSSATDASTDNTSSPGAPSPDTAAADTSTTREAEAASAVE